MNLALFKKIFLEEFSAKSSGPKESGQKLQINFRIPHTKIGLANFPVLEIWNFEKSFSL